MAFLDRQTRKKMASVFLLLPFIISPLLLGGVFHHILWSRIIMGVVSASMVVILLFYTTRHRQLVVSPVLLLPLFLAIIALFQLIPLPSSLYCLFSVERCVVLKDSGFMTHPLSLAVPETLYSFFRLLTLTLFTFLLATFIKARPTRIREMAKAIVFITTVFIILALIAKSVGVTHWLDGAFKRESIFFSFPIINTNNAGGWLGISGIISLFLLQTHTKNAKIFYIFIFVLHAIALLATLSRGAILAFVISVVFYVLFSNRFSQRKEIRYTAFALVPILFLVFYAGYTTAERALFPETILQDKIEAALLTIKMLGSFPLFGIGLGAFATVFTFVQGNPEINFIYPENDPAHLLIEVGIVGGVIFFILLFFIVVRYRKTDEIAPYIALLFVALHNLVDFNIHLFAVQFPVLFLLVWISPGKVVSRKLYRHLLVSTALLIGGSIFLYALFTHHDEFPAQLENESYETMEYRYPFSYRPPLKKAISLLKQKDGFSYAGVYLAKASALAPRYYYPLFITGTYFLKLGSFSESANAFSRALHLAPEGKIRTMVSSIFSVLKLYRRVDLLPQILHQTGEKRALIEERLTSLMTPGFSSIFFQVKREYPLVYARALLVDKEFETAVSFIQERIDGVSKKQRIAFLKMLISIQLQTRKQKDALVTMRKLAQFHSDFYTTLRYATTLFRYGDYTQNELRMLQHKLLEQSMSERKKTARLYYWTSEVSWKQKEYKKSLDYVRKALVLEDNNGWRLTLVKRLQYAGVYKEALKHLQIIQQNSPEWRDKYLKKIEMSLKKEINRRLF